MFSRHKNIIVCSFVRSLGSYFICKNYEQKIENLGKTYNEGHLPPRAPISHSEHRCAPLPLCTEHWKHRCILLRKPHVLRFQHAPPFYMQDHRSRSMDMDPQPHLLRWIHMGVLAPRIGAIHHFLSHDSRAHDVKNIIVFYSGLITLPYNSGN